MKTTVIMKVALLSQLAVFAPPSFAAQPKAGRHGIVSSKSKRTLWRGSKIRTSTTTGTAKARVAAKPKPVAKSGHAKPHPLIDDTRYQDLVAILDGVGPIALGSYPLNGGEVSGRIEFTPSGLVVHQRFHRSEVQHNSLGQTERVETNQELPSITIATAADEELLKPYVMLSMSGPTTAIRKATMSWFRRSERRIDTDDWDHLLDRVSWRNRSDKAFLDRFEPKVLSQARSKWRELSFPQRERIETEGYMKVGEGADTHGVQVKRGIANPTFTVAIRTELLVQPYDATNRKHRAHVLKLAPSWP